MTDLFATTPQLRPGQGNAAFLCDLADNTPDSTMNARLKRGDYGPLNPRFAKGWRRLFGRTNT